MRSGDVIQIKSGHMSIADEHASKILVYNSFAIVEYLFQVSKGGETGNYIMILDTIEDILFIWYNNVTQVALGMKFPSFYGLQIQVCLIGSETRLVLIRQTD